MTDHNERENKKWRPSNVVASSGNAIEDRVAATKGIHVVWYTDRLTVITLGHCESDPDRNARDIFVLAQSWSRELVDEIVQRRAFEELPIGCYRSHLEEQSCLGSTVDCDFYWNGKPWVCVNVPAMLSITKSDEIWREAMQLTSRGQFEVTPLFVG